MLHQRCNADGRLEVSGALLLDMPLCATGSSFSERGGIDCCLIEGDDAC